MRNIVFPRPGRAGAGGGVARLGWCQLVAGPLSPALRQAAPSSTPQCQLTQASSGDHCARDQ